MGAQAVFLDRVAQCPIERRPSPATLSPEDARLLTCLRMFARQAKIAPRLDLDRACALIAPHPSEAMQIWGSTLLRALDAQATRAVVFHAGCAARPGFDELWLLRIIRLFQQGDDAGARFLIAGRVPHRARRKIAFLAARFAANFTSPA